MEWKSRTNITDKIVSYLKNNIRSGVWQPGDKISSENELTETLKVSRASVRYAIQHLVAIGILESFQGKGTYVKSIPVEKIDEKFKDIYKNTDMGQLLEFRKIIETESCRLAAKRVTKKSLAEMQKYLRIMDKNTDNSEVFIENDMAFHMEILKATQNELVVRSIQCVEAEIRRQQYWFNTAEGVDNAVRYHTAILEALRQSEGEMAAKLMDEHINKLIYEFF